MIAVTERWRPRIFHITGDYPDPVAEHKTKVFARLIGLVEDRFDNRIISINRRTPGALGLAKTIGNPDAVVEESVAIPGGEAIRYVAPPLGIMHAKLLERLGDWIAQRASTDSPPDLIIGHKLTIEGIAAARAAKRLGIPYALTLQGNTDRKILRARPDLHRQLRTVYREAACVFALAPWIASYVDEKLGPRENAPVILPAPVGEGFAVTPPKPDQTGFLSAFNLRDYRVKNLAGLVRAMGELEEDGAPGLRIAGGGDARSWRIVQSIIKPAPRIELLGHRTPDQLSKLMNESIALVLPSRRESFGLVFIEALRSGCPVIYPSGAAIDGYLNEASFAIPVDARNPSAIAAAMRNAAANQTSIKADLLAWQERGGLDRFSNERIAADFAAGIESAHG